VAHQQGFVCAINRDRDGYQVPLALHEAGLLTSFVTDFYAPDRARGWLPRRLRARHVAGLPASATRSVATSFALQSVAEIAGLPMHPVFAVSDRLLGLVAARVARRRHAHLYCYANYLPPERAIAPGTRRAIFEYHPLSGLFRELLEADFARFPHVAWSFARELRDLHESAGDEPFRRADTIACASAMTRRSLIHAGCDPARITVIPYGFEPEPAAPPTGRGDGPCEFLFVGQGVQRKGLHHLIEAWQASGLRNARLTLVCYRIDPGIRDRIADPSITLLERQSREALDLLYRRADVFVMPSIIEGFGLVYLEALARGCHVIGTDNTGLPDLDLPASAATVLPVGDLDALASALAAARDRHGAGGFDRPAIAAAAAGRPWRAFRQEIAAHARTLLTDG
jgi:glycosyltransferase involved in cell wall biosynthesis